jgi:cation transport regulator ChaC
MIWYFAYGSNLSQERFRSRVGEWQQVRQAVLDGYELRFSGDVESEGGGGVYAITEDQLAAMDAVELHGPMNLHGRGIRSTVELVSDGELIEGELYEVPAPEVFRAPSATYLGLITSGLRDFGYTEDVIAAVEAAAATEPDQPA